MIRIKDPNSVTGSYITNPCNRGVTDIKKLDVCKRCTLKKKWEKMICYTRKIPKETSAHDLAKKRLQNKDKVRI